MQCTICNYACSPPSLPRSKSSRQQSFCPYVQSLVEGHRSAMVYTPKSYVPYSGIM